MPGDFSQVAALAASLKSGSTQVNAATRKTTRESAKAVERGAKSRAPVDTGELVANIKASTRGNYGQVTSTSRQGFFQEYGTSVMPAQPSMIPALEAEAPKYARALELAAYEAVTKAVGG